MSLHRFNASRPQAMQVATSHAGSFGIGAAVLCPVMNTTSGLTVDYDRAASAKAQLQAMLAAIARNDAVAGQGLDQMAVADTSGETRRLAN
jgi:hypothetical protein